MTIYRFIFKIINSEKKSLNLDFNIKVDKLTKMNICEIYYINKKLSNKNIE